MKFPKSIFANSKLTGLSSKRWLKKGRSTVSRSEQSSFSSGSSSSAESYQLTNGGRRTPNSILDLPRSDDFAYDNVAASPLPFPGLLQAIKNMDTDNDGIVSHDDLQAFFNKIGYFGDISPVLNDNDTVMPVISVDELNARLNSACNPPADPDELRDVFSLFDVDGDGRITAEELQRMLSSVGEDNCSLEDCKQMIAAVAQKDTEFVCFEDFSTMMNQNAQLNVFM